ncbi:hypothetical protein R6Q59_013132 [Mikania micrantha]
MCVLQHKHLLTLIDLNPKYPHDEQVYDDEEDLIIKQAFQHSCDLCNQEITYLHRYYYKCDQCEYSVHKLCEELPKTLVHASHIEHTLSLFQVTSYKFCRICESLFQYKELSYHCSPCRLDLCLKCSMNGLQCHIIYHPSHQHPLTPTSREILVNCDACKKDHKGIFYHCTTCSLSFIHKECVFRPKRLMIQKSTHHRFFHSHPLILTYSFSKANQMVIFYPKCRVCDKTFIDDQNCWIYKCDKCRYYVHLDCAYLRDVLLTSNECEDDPSSLHLPLSDHTYNMIKDVVFKETNETSITHNSHKHPLLLVDTLPMNISYNEVVCNACLIPIKKNTTYYKCTYECNFVLHDWCTRLPVELKDYKGHPQHTLLLLPKVGDTFKCHVCNDVWNGFVYSCFKCGYDIDVICALIRGKIIHKSHPYHRLSRGVSNSARDSCRMCSSGFTFEKNNWLGCKSCKFNLHLGCALLLPETIRHKYDKHPMTLCYTPVENHEGDYFCEVCEEMLNPNASFYHCHECDQSMHTECAPLIPQTKAYIHAAPREPDPMIDFGSRYLRAKFVAPYI